MCLRIGERK
jgi:hypothetical protein